MIQVCVRPEDVKKVRGLILSLAISGKLTSKEVSSGDISGTFFIPLDWKWCTLSEIAACRGSAKAGSDGIKPSDWILDMEDIDGATGTVHTRATFKERSSLSTKSAFKPGDVLYGKLRPYLNKVVLADSPGFCTTEIIPITPGATIEARYLQIVLRSPYFLEYVTKRSYGMKMPRLGTKDLESARIPLPPLAEQKRIIAKVDELMALCDQLEAQLKERDVKQAALANAALAKFTEDPTPENLQPLFHPSFSIEPDNLRKAVLNLATSGALITDKETLPGNKLGDHVEFLNGYAFKSQWFKESGIKLCRNINVGHGSCVWKEAAHVEQTVADEFKRFELKKGDIVLSLDRPLISTGLKIARIREADLPCLLLQRVARPTPKHADLDLEFLFLWFMSPKFTDSIDPGRSNGVPHISTSQLLDLEFRVPKIEGQRGTVEKVSMLLTIISQLEAQLDASRTTGEKLLEAMVAELTSA